MNSLAQLLDTLDDWRHLPTYQLERRADILFAMHLPAFLSDRYGVKVNPLLVPEFPVHFPTLYPDTPGNKSFKIDYAAFAEDLSRAWLMELKTDTSSRRNKQNANMDAAMNAGMPKLIDGVLKLVAATDAKHKYCHLLRLLERLSLVELPDNLDDALNSRHWASAVNACLPNVINKAPANPLQVLFLQPVSAGPDEIGFNEFADWLDNHGPDARRFARSLREWATVRAGHRA